MSNLVLILILLLLVGGGAWWYMRRRRQERCAKLRYVLGASSVDIHQLSQLLRSWGYNPSEFIDKSSDQNVVTSPKVHTHKLMQEFCQ